MGTKVIYDGPEGQANHEVGVATGAGDLLEPGAVYEVDAELADRLVRSSPWWSRVRDYDAMSVPQLKEAAKLEGIDGYSGMTKPQLVDALRGAETADEPEPEPEPEGEPEGDTTSEEDEL